MHSGIYTGLVRHRRFSPRDHRFQYPVFMMYLDMDEIDSVLALSPWWSRKPWRPARFRRNDFIGDASLTVDDAVRKIIEEKTGKIHAGPIRMLVNLSYFGFNINPICCYYCFDEKEKLQLIVVDVHNTPWKERQNYVLECDPQRKVQRITFNKRMHVSPFNPMDMVYHWRSNCPSQHLRLHLETWHRDSKHVDATLALKREEISSKSLTRLLWLYPFMTIKVVVAIYWQALKLWVKKVPVYDHPAGEIKN